MQRITSSLALGLILVISAPATWALNLGKGVLGSTLGQPLNFSVNVNSEPEEGITAECVSAEVYSGDNKLAPGAVRVSSDASGGATQFNLRVVSNSIIDEPVVTVAVALGCPARVTRRFILFVDPPLLVNSADAAGEQNFRPLANDNGVSARTSSSKSAARSARAKSGSSSSAPKRARAAANRSVRSDAAVRPQRRNTAPAAVQNGGSAAKAELQRLPALAKTPEPIVAAPRLKLDSAPRVAAIPPQSASSAALLAEALAAKAVADAASAAAATTALQEAELRATRRVAALEESLQKLKAEAQTSRKAMDSLQASVREAETKKSSSVLVWALSALSAVLALVVGALLWLRARRLRNPSWWTGGAAAANPSADQHSSSFETRNSRAPVYPNSTAQGSPAASAQARDSFTVASGPAPLSAAASTARTSVFGSPAKLTTKAVSSLAGSFGPTLAPDSAKNQVASGDEFASQGSSRELSVEELIDLEQQSDFFVVLGQDEAAVDLLMTHLRVTGGVSPMPYMKLLEIYRRTGNADAYERIRQRFNQRFNAEVPSSDVDPAEGRSITDYADTLGELMSVWPTPHKAVDTLGRWLAKSDADPIGGTVAFDMPAYSELLFLHSLARDLLARETRTVESGSIDMLLPLAADAVSPISTLQPSLVAEAPGLLADSGYDLDLDLTLPMPLAAATTNSKQTDYDNAGPKSDFMSLNIDSRFQS